MHAMTPSGPEYHDPVARERARPPGPARLAAEALASIDAEVVNRLGDARVASVLVGAGAGAPAANLRLEPPARLEDAIALAAARVDGKRAFCVELTSGACLWLGARFRFALLESADDAAARRDALALEGNEAPAPHVRARR